MKFKAKEIAALLNGQVEGNPEVQVDCLSKIEEGVPGSLTFLANPKYTPFVYTTHASVIVVNRDFTPDKQVTASLIRVDDSYVAFGRLLEIYNQMKSARTGISDRAFVSPTAIVGKDVFIGEFAFIGDQVVVGDHAKIYPQVYLGDKAEVGPNTILYPGVKVYAESKIGKDCILHSGVVVGADGFGFAPREGAPYFKLAQIGNVVIEDDVEIGANSTIDRATLGSTIIRKGVKLDNQIQVGHNVEIGENTVISAMTGISGSTRIGRNCQIGGQVGFIGHISIADNVKIVAQSGIAAGVKEDGAVLMGSPAIDIAVFKRSAIHFRNLDTLSKRITALEQELKKLKEG